MTVYAAFLSGGSQIGPVIAGYLVQARGWRWFFILCAIIAAVNFCTTFFLLPETLYEEEMVEAAVDTEKGTENQIKTTQSTRRTNGRATMDYKAYWKSLFSVSISKEARRNGLFKYLICTFLLPLPLLLVPGILLASIMFGVVLGG